MTRTLQTAPSAKLPRLALLLVAMTGLGLAGCDDTGKDPSVQIGANPVLPKLQQYFVPPIRIAKSSHGQSTNRMIASFSVAEYLILRLPHPQSCFF